MVAIERFVAKKGLEGVVFDTSSVSNVIPSERSLYYRGYPVDQLAERCQFEEVAYLLLYGELPTAEQLGRFCQQEKEARGLSSELLDVVKQFPIAGHPMDAIRTCVSYLGMQPEFSGPAESARTIDQGISLLAKIPTIIGAFARHRRGEDPLPPRDDLSFAANFFHLCHGTVPDPEIVKAFDGSLTLYAEHGFNASTFSARVIASTESDLCGAASGAIAALKGPLHGGANEAVMLLLQEIGDPNNAAAWLDDALANKKKIMGFGHRLYRNGDSRVPAMSRYRELLAQRCDGQKWLEISQILESAMLDKKNICANLDFPAGPVFYMMGFEIDLFTPIFVMSRITGWTAHVAEQLADNRLVRPLAEYIGQGKRDVPLPK